MFLFFGYLFLRKDYPLSIRRISLQSKTSFRLCEVEDFADMPKPHIYLCLITYCNTKRHRIVSELSVSAILVFSPKEQEFLQNRSDRRKLVLACELLNTWSATRLSKILGLGILL